MTMFAEDKRKLRKWVEAHPFKGTVHRKEFFVNQEGEPAMLVVSKLMWYAIRALLLDKETGEPRLVTVADAMTLVKANRVADAYLLAQEAKAAAAGSALPLGTPSTLPCSPSTDLSSLHGAGAPKVSLGRPSKSKGPSRAQHSYNICIVSDFFYPRLGGVELHQYQLAQGLIRRGHKVIIVTGTYGSEPGQRQGIRYLTSGLKVYYCPQMAVTNQVSLPTLYLFFPLFRQILVREQVDIVHGHQSTSMLAHECILHARTMGLRAVYTDHSLFGFADAGAIHLNKMMMFTLSDVDHVVCVSHCSKENLVLRACLDPDMVSVIPNAVDTSKFTPAPEMAPPIEERINIIVLSRLVYRKGVDLVVEVIPEICRRFPSVHFIIGGDGNKRLLLEEMRERHQLHDRVEMLGAIQHKDVRSVLVRGHIFLNCSLTEAFCIAILEAVSCGLFVVSTRVGGVPEILPERMIQFAEPNALDIVEVLSDAIPQAKDIRPMELHTQVKQMYNWHAVAERTEAVYDQAMLAPRGGLARRLRKYHECGPFSGPLFAMVAALDVLVWRLIQWIWPREETDLAVPFPTKYYQQVKDKL